MRRAFLLGVVLACVSLFGTERAFTQASKLSARTGTVVTPRNFPNQTADDLSDMFRLDAELGTLAVFRINWNDANLWDASRTLVRLADQQRLTSVLELSPFKANALKGATLDPPKNVPATGGRLSLTNPAVSQPFITSVLQLAQLKPPYLAVATDANLLWQSDPAEFAALADLYGKVYPRIKEIAPDTKVFVTFQWEAMQSQDAAANRRLIAAFGKRLDLLAVTSDSRKLFEKSGPSGIPADYYTRVSNYSDGREVFVETQWPSEGGSGEADQVSFIRALPRLLEPLKPSMVAWTFLHDVRLLKIFTIKAGLLTPDGHPKPAFAAFREIRDDSQTARSAGTGTIQAGAQNTRSQAGTQAPARFGIYTAKLDGSEVRTLLTSPDREMTHPRVSPDGKRITFTLYNNRGKDGRATEDEGYENTEVMVMNVDGTGVESIVPARRGIVSANGCWTPDGKSLIYISTDGAPGIRQIDLATRRITRVPIPADLKFPTDPHWERTRIVFPVKAAPGGADALWIMNADGTGARQLTHPARSDTRSPGLYGDFDPKLSPDESSVAFMRIDGGISWRVMVLDVRRGIERLLTPSGEIEGLPTWSSDGRLLLFRHIDIKKPVDTGLWTMKPDGTERRAVPLPKGLLYNHGSFFPGDGSSPTARIIYTGSEMPSR